MRFGFGKWSEIDKLEAQTNKSRPGASNWAACLALSHFGDVAKRGVVMQRALTTLTAAHSP